MDKKTADIMEKFVASCNGMCLVKDVNYLKGLLNESNIASLPNEFRPAACENGIYINIFMSSKKSYIIPIANISALLLIISITDVQSAWDNIKNMLYLSNNKNFKYDEQIVTYNNDDYSIILTSGDAMNIRSIFIVDKESRQAISIIRKKVAWIKAITTERFVGLEPYIKYERCIGIKKYIDLLPDCFKDKIIPMLVISVLNS